MRGGVGKSKKKGGGENVVKKKTTPAGERLYNGPSLWVKFRPHSPRQDARVGKRRGKGFHSTAETCKSPVFGGDNQQGKKGRQETGGKRQGGQGCKMSEKKKKGRKTKGESGRIEANHRMPILCWYVTEDKTSAGRGGGTGQKDKAL